MAQEDIKQNGTILPDVELAVIGNNDGCHLDKVMRTFINYYVRPDGVLGVLGPPCSETVDPVASKQFVYFIYRKDRDYDRVVILIHRSSNHTNI